jgi:hypothetical protein
MSHLPLGRVGANVALFDFLQNAQRRERWVYCSRVKSQKAKNKSQTNSKQ